MNGSALRELFSSMLRSKFDFEDFLNAPVPNNYAPAVIQGRTIYRPNNKLKAYHRFLNTVLFERLPINESVAYAYRKGINPHEAVKPHARSRAFFQTDIRDFFSSIGRDIVRDKLLKPGPSILISDLPKHIERILDLILVDGVLPVGFATSPPISNACLMDFDSDLQNHCRNADLVYTRYSDDIIISAKNREHLNDIKRTITHLLGKHFGEKLVLNDEKSKLTTIGRKVRILGLVVLPSGDVAIDMELKRHIEVLIHYSIQDEEIFLKKAREPDRQAGLAKLCGYISYINAADPPYLEKLRRKYGAAVIDSFLHRSVQ